MPARAVRVGGARLAQLRVKDTAIRASAAVHAAARIEGVDHAAVVEEVVVPVPLAARFLCGARWVDNHVASVVRWGQKIGGLEIPSRVADVSMTTQPLDMAVHARFHTVVPSIHDSDVCHSIPHDFELREFREGNGGVPGGPNVSTDGLELTSSRTSDACSPGKIV